MPCIIVCYSFYFWCSDLLQILCKQAAFLFAVLRITYAFLVNHYIFIFARVTGDEAEGFNPYIVCI